MEMMRAESTRQTPPAPVVEAALNDIRTEIGGGLIKISATLNRAGLAKLKKKIDALAILIDDEDEGEDAPEKAG